jgi:peroxiredoxin
MKFFFLLLCASLATYGLHAQTFFPNKQSVVKDSTGRIYSFDEWKILMLQGCSFQALDPSDPNTEFRIGFLSEKQKAERLKNMPKPIESRYFTTGDHISNFSAKDMNGDQVKLKDLKGKIVVINFWFIHCEPCRVEIPELNKMVDSYNNNDSIVFIAIALDQKPEIKNFLKENKFNYRIISDGRTIAKQYAIGSYPTHLVLDPEGKVYFHTSGLAMNTVYWLNRSISELLNKGSNEPTD